MANALKKPSERSKTEVEVPPAYPVPVNEARRVATLWACGILDTPPEAFFDRIVELAAELCDTPIALVSLVDRSRQWFKARVGIDLRQTPRTDSLCAHAIVCKRGLVVPDARLDRRFVSHPLVTGPPHLRAYAAAPVSVDDCAVGTVCALDTRARPFRAAQVDGLRTLARRTGAELELRLCLARAEGRTQVELGGADPSADVASEEVLRTREEVLAHAAPPTDGSPDERWQAELPVPPGAVLCDRYRVERAIGGGGMGVVAAALDLKRGKRVALKFMRPQALAQPPALRRFSREARFLFALDSEHFARVFDFGKLRGGAPFLVMEHLEGLDLANYLTRRGRLPPQESIELMLQACAAVQVAHAHGILHRDLKPANLFLTWDPEGNPLLKVLDFGISKLAEADVPPDTALTGDATELGSASYMSPEQMLASAKVDVRTDLWSLGVVLYELLSGHPPFAGANRIEICANVLTAPAPDLGEARPGLPTDLVQVVGRCLEKQPQQRYRSVLELSAALRACRAGEHRQAGASGPSEPARQGEASLQSG